MPACLDKLVNLKELQVTLTELHHQSSHLGDPSVEAGARPPPFGRQIFTPSPRHSFQPAPCVAAWDAWQTGSLRELEAMLQEVSTGWDDLKASLEPALVAVGDELRDAYEEAFGDKM
jgi:hypothetical protein